MPLSMCQIGSTVILKDFMLSPELINRLYCLGMIKGAFIKVISVEYNGPMTIELLGSKIALGYDIISNIQVVTSKYHS
ncbi:FeoA family protein [Acetobacterium bakii]|uniref:Ferrous iron transporter FeoA-like domain-containing protein n=1 Tax=Acetobacterium bakii TaxID=52689 RepID=A0A0L6TY81_9FIRM|nr:FeoA family protein [Acetobacterium bakii]KNZ41221.1 hypothetical protein AKG39_12930 [Acetobacterium bakii]